MKRGIRDAIAFAIAFALVAGLVLNLSRSGVTPSAKAVGSKEINEIKQGKKAVNDRLYLKFGDKAAIYDDYTKTFAVSVDLKDPEWEKGRLTGLFEGGREAKLYFDESYKRYDKRSSVINGKQFYFIAVNGDEYGEYLLIFYDKSMLGQ